MIPGILTNLRAVDRSDLDRIHAWLSDPDLMRAWGYGAAAPSRDATITRIENWLLDEDCCGHPVALIIETLDGHPAGLLVLSDLQPIDRSCELSLFLESAHRDQGIGSDVIESLAGAAFEQWNLHRLTARSEQHNIRAHAFFLGNGFHHEGTLRAARFLNGNWRDIEIFGRIRPSERSEP